jgi:hypothetical protein
VTSLPAGLVVLSREGCGLCADMLAELIEAHQQLAYDKSTLTAELTELREQLESAGQRA